MRRTIYYRIWNFVLPAGIATILLFTVQPLAAKVLSADSSWVLNQTNFAELFAVTPNAKLDVNEPEIRAGLLYDAVNRKIIWQKNMHSAYPIASLTKMMVSFLTVEDVRKGVFNWEDKVEWTRVEYRGSGKNRKRVNVKVTYSLLDLFKASMIASNNECSEQMARFLGKGDLSATIARMNQRAIELGMQQTFYGNPTGLPASKWMNDNSSTPVDQLLLTLEMLKYQEILDIAGMGYASIENGSATSVIRNHNKLTIDYSGEVDGLKTGYTRRAGFCLVATTAKCEHRLIGIVLGCRTPQIRNEIMRDLFDNYYTSIGLDKLGPYCINPSAEKSNPATPVNGEMVTVKESVKKSHKIKSGETLSGIAAKYRCNVSDIKRWNPSVSGSGRIYAGKTLTVYTKVSRNVFIQKPANGTEEEDDKTLAENVVNQNPKPASSEAKKETVTPVKSTPTPIAKSVSSLDDNYVYHTVEPGDTLTSIAKKYEGSTVEQLKKLNQIKDARLIKPGMKLKVPVQI